MLPGEQHLHVCVSVLNSQAVYHSPPVSSVVLLLPLGQPPDQLQDGALGEGRVPVGRPADELEVLHQAVTVLWLRRRPQSTSCSKSKGKVKVGKQLKHLPSATGCHFIMNLESHCLPREIKVFVRLIFDFFGFTHCSVS